MGLLNSQILNSEPISPNFIAKMMYFTILVEAGSLLKACEVMDISTTTGSRWLAELESELDVSLYRRNDKHHRITPAGEHLYRNFKSIHSNIQILKNELSQYSSEKKGTVRVCCSPVYAENVVLPLTSEFIKTNPQVNIQMTISPRGLIQHKNNDFIISSISESNIHKEEELDLIRKTLLRERYVVVASPSFIQHSGQPEHPQDLINFRCIYSIALSGNNHWVFKKDDVAQTVMIEKTIELSAEKMITKGVLSGAGIAYLPEFLVKRHIDAGELIQLLADYETDYWLLNLYYPTRKYMTGAALAFKEVLLSQHKTMLRNFDS